MKRENFSGVQSPATQQDVLSVGVASNDENKNSNSKIVYQKKGDGIILEQKITENPD
jgi:TPP-dependent pyruvate/acetoin dehydrogenase alpha subunit